MTEGPALFLPHFSGEMGTPAGQAGQRGAAPREVLQRHPPEGYAPRALGRRDFHSNRMEIPYVFHRNPPRRGAASSPSGSTPSAPPPWGFGLAAAPGRRPRRSPARPILSSTCSSKAPPAPLRPGHRPGDRRHRRPDERLHHQGVHLLLCPGAGRATWPRPRTSSLTWSITPAFAQAAVETERGVILEEIDMYEDTPDDLCAEKLFGAVFQGSPLARPILGATETLDTMDGGRSSGSTSSTHYRGDNTVVALAGSFTQEDAGRAAPALCRPAGGPPQPCGAGDVYPRVRGHAQAHRAEPPDPGFPRRWTTTPPGGLPSSCSPPFWGAGVSSRLFQTGAGAARGCATPSTPTGRATPTPGCSASTPP